MRPRYWTLLVAPILLTSCNLRSAQDAHSPRITRERAAAVEAEVRHFVATVATDVTQQGPAAWRKHFADTPAFFMASDGHLVFPTRQAAAQAIDQLTHSIKSIELRWGDDLRVDTLTEDLAILAASWSENQVDVAGHQVQENGFFTGLVEKRNGQWQFRNAHWSSAVPPPKAP